MHVHLLMLRISGWLLAAVVVACRLENADPPAARESTGAMVAGDRRRSNLTGWLPRKPPRPASQFRDRLQSPSVPGPTATEHRQDVGPHQQQATP